MAHILVLSNDKDICGVIEFLLNRERNDTVISASDLQKVQALAQQQVPDLIILESTVRVFGDQSGFPVYQQLRTIESLKQVPILFWMIPNPSRVNPEAQQLGVAGCVAMPSQPQELLEARDVILAGGTYFPPLV